MLSSVIAMSFSAHPICPELADCSEAHPLAPSALISKIQRLPRSNARASIERDSYLEAELLSTA